MVRLEGLRERARLATAWGRAPDSFSISWGRDSSDEPWASALKRLHDAIPALPRLFLCYLPTLCVQEGRLDPSIIVTHTVPLDQAPEHYKLYNDKLEGCIKVLLKPGAEAA